MKLKEKFKFNLHQTVLDLAYYIQKKSIHKFENGMTFVFPIGDLLWNHPLLLKFTEFCVVGAIGLVPNYAVFWSLLWWNPSMAWFCGYLAGACFNFLIDLKFVFTHENAVSYQDSVKKRMRKPE
jgi:hypothetical protein